MRVHRHGPLPRSELLARLAGVHPRDLWRTPPEIAAWARDRWGVVLDAAATPEDAICGLPCIPPWEDGLAVSWARRVLELDDAGDGDGLGVWANPPYSREGGGILAWVEKAVAEFRAGVNPVLLVPPATGTSYWALVEETASEIWLSRGRWAFLHPDTGQPVRGNRGDSAVVAWTGGPRVRGFLELKGDQVVATEV